MKTHWILPASAVWFINFNLTSHELSLDTIGFSRMEFQFRPILLEKQSWRLKLKLHAAEADGICDHLSASHFRFKLNLHAAKAGGVY